MLFRLSPTFLFELRKRVGKPLPNTTGTVILTCLSQLLSQLLSPLLEEVDSFVDTFVDMVLEEAQRELAKENECRSVQKTFWTLKILKERHIQVAAFNVTKCLEPYLDMGGEERSERISSQSPSNENNPCEG